MIIRRQEACYALWGFRTPNNAFYFVAKDNLHDDAFLEKQIFRNTSRTAALNAFDIPSHYGERVGKFLFMLFALNTPRYVTNHTLHTDFNIPYVNDVIHERINKHHNKLEVHPNPLLEPLLQPVNTYLLTYSMEQGPS